MLQVRYDLSLFFDVVSSGKILKFLGKKKHILSSSFEEGTQISSVFSWFSAKQIMCFGSQNSDGRH